MPSYSVGEPRKAAEPRAWYTVWPVLNPQGETLVAFESEGEAQNLVDYFNLVRQGVLVPTPLAEQGLA